MEDRPERVAQFKEEIAAMRLRDPSTARDRLMLRLGIGLMGLGVVLGIYAYTLSHGTTDPLQQRDAIVIAVLGVALSVVGGALFVRYSVAQFLRFWLARLTYEQQAQTDRVVEALTHD
ncbi:MAG: hypothetical protein QOD92_1258 [Acidimicrobiaceae bacterium]|jgi:hypothetical protein